MSQYGLDTDHLNEDQKAQAKAKTLEFFTKSHSLDIAQYIDKCHDEDLLYTEELIVDEVKGMLHAEAMKQESTVNLFEKVIYSLSGKDLADVCFYHPYNMTHFLIKHGAIKKNNGKYSFVKPLGVWQKKREDHQKAAEEVVVSREFVEKLAFMSWKDKLIASAEDSFEYMTALSILVEHLQISRKDVQKNPQKYKEMGIHDEGFLDGVVVYYQGIVQLMVRSAVLLNYALVEYRHSKKYKAETAFLSGIWPIGLTREEVGACVYQDAGPSGMIDHLAKEICDSILYDKELTDKNCIELFQMHEKGLLTKRTGEHAMRHHMSNLKYQEYAIIDAKKTMLKKQDVSVKELRDLFDPECSKVIELASDFSKSKMKASAFETARGIRMSLTREQCSDLVNLYEKINELIALFYRTDTSLKDRTNQVFQYYLRTLEELKQAENVLYERKPEPKKAPEPPKPVSQPAVLKRKSEPVVEGLVIQDKDVLSAGAQIQRTTAAKRMKTAENAHEKLSSTPMKNGLLNQFEILQLSDDEMRFNDLKKVEKEVLEALKQHQFYGAVGECIQKMETKREALKKQIKEETSMKHRLSYLLGASIVVAVVLFLLFSKFTAFLWSVEMEETVQVILYIACGILGLIAGGFLGLLAGIAIPSFIVALITSFISIASLFKIILCLIGGCLVLFILSIGFSDPRKNTDVKEIEKEIDQLHAQCKKHVNAVLLALRKRNTTEYKHVIEYYQKALQKLDELKV